MTPKRLSTIQIIVFIVALFATAVFAGQDAKGPALNEVQKLQLQNAAQKMEITQLRAQAALREFEKSKDDLMQMMKGLKVEGYTLDLQSMSYQKEPTKSTDK